MDGRIFEKKYRTFLEFEAMGGIGESDVTKNMFICDEVFDIATYDTGLSELIGAQIVEVAKAIQARETFEIIKDKDNYLKFILVCNVFRNYKLLDWGSSIRGAWFNTEIVELGVIDDIKGPANELMAKLISFVEE